MHKFEVIMKFRESLLIIHMFHNKKGFLLRAVDPLQDHTDTIYKCTQK